MDKGSNIAGGLLFTPNSHCLLNSHKIITWELWQKAKDDGRNTSKKLIVIYQ